MKSNYRRIGDYIKLVDNRNIEMREKNLLGLSISKEFIPSVANIIGTDMSNYKIIKKGQFACSTMQVRRDKKMPVALLEDYDEALISAAYPVFEVVNTEILLPEYLMMWFRRSEFDREACFYAVGGVRGSIEWEDFCDMKLPVPSIDQQKNIVNEYSILENQIRLNKKFIRKSEEIALSLYKQWFTSFKFPYKDENLNHSIVEEVELSPELEEVLPEGWKVGCIGDYSKVKSGYAFKSELWKSFGVPVIKIGSIQNNSIDFRQVGFVSKEIAKKTSNYSVARGDIVIAMTGATIGKVGIVPDFHESILVNQRVGMFSLGSEPLEKAAFLYFTLLQDYVINEITNAGGDSAQANISNNEIEKIKLIIPPSTQIKSFNEVGKPILELILTKIKENDTLEKTINILLSKLSKVEKDL